MKKITSPIKEKAKKHYLEDNFLDFIELFFSNVNHTPDGIEFETWTDGGVNMVHYLQTSDGYYFMQFRGQANGFNVDEEINLHRQDERYLNDFKIRESVNDFESYQKYLNKIASLID